MKGERACGRSGIVDVEGGEKGDSESGAVARRGVSGRKVAKREGSGLSGASTSSGRGGRGLRAGLPPTSTVGVIMVTGDSDTRGTIVSFICGQLSNTMERCQAAIMLAVRLRCCPE